MKAIKQLINLLKQNFALAVTIFGYHNSNNACNFFCSHFREKVPAWVFPRCANAHNSYYLTVKSNC